MDLLKLISTNTELKAVFDYYREFSGNAFYYLAKLINRLFDDNSLQLRSHKLSDDTILEAKIIIDNSPRINNF